MRLSGIIFLVSLSCALLQAEDRRFVRVNLCGLYDESWHGRPTDDKKCLIVEIPCQRSGNQFVAGTVDAVLDFKSFQSQIAAVTGSLNGVKSDEERRELKALLADLTRRATWANPVCAGMTKEGAVTVTPIVANTVTPLTILPTIISPAERTKHPIPTATSTSTPSITLPPATSGPTQTPVPTATPTPVPVGNGEFERIFPAIQKSSKGAGVGDFDGDGDSDVAVGLSASAQVQIYFNDGSGIFRDGQLISVSSSPGDMQVVDMNSDGILDLVVGYDAGTSITVLLGQGVNGVGNGTFAAPQTQQVSSSSSVQTLYIGQFDSGSTLDVAVALAGQNKLTISLGNGDGTFQPAQDVSIPIQGPQEIDGGDFDTDGDLDLIVANSTGGVVVLLNGGSGTFSNGGTISCGSPSNQMTDIKVLDFSGDTEPDIVALNGTTATICLSAGNQAIGNATFGTPVSISTGAGTPQRLVVRDLNSDSEPDLVVGSSNGRLQIFTGQLTAPEFVAETDSIFIGGSTVTSMSLADLTGSGVKDDLVIGTDSSASLNGLAVLHGVAGPDFVPPGSHKTGMNPVDVVTNDLNGDGRHDIVTVNAGSRDVSVFLNLGGEGFPVGFSIRSPMIQRRLLWGIFQVTEFRILLWRQQTLGRYSGPWEMEVVVLDHSV